MSNRRTPLLTPKLIRDLERAFARNGFDEVLIQTLSRGRKLGLIRPLLVSGPGALIAAVSDHVRLQSIQSCFQPDAFWFLESKNRAGEMSAEILSFCRKHRLRRLGDLADKFRSDLRIDGLRDHHLHAIEKALKYYGLALRYDLD